MAIPPDDFKYISNLVYKNAAIVLDTKKDYLVEARLTTLIREEGISDTKTLFDKLRAPRGEQLQSKVVDAMTTNETSFFRDNHPFEELRLKILPALIKNREKEKKLTIWCAACSSGQEPYTIAMVLHSYFKHLRSSNWKIKIIASDISDKMLATAKSGNYNQIEINRGLPLGMRDRFFTKNGNSWTIIDELRNSIEFKKINLVERLIGLPRLDIIFIRNVLIYFDMETKAAILSKMANLMYPDSVLYIGSSETIIGVTDKLERISTSRSSIFQIKT